MWRANQMAQLSGLGNRLYSGETSFNIIGNRKRWYSISAVFVLISIGALAIQGLHLGIEFKGGSSYTVNKAGISVEEARATVEEAGIAAIAHKAAVGTQMMIDLYDAWLADLGYTLLTSRDPNERGGHISIGHPQAAQICVALRKFVNVIPDYRTPNAIRLAIAPLPTSYVEIWDGFERLRDLTLSRKYEEIKGSDSRVT